MNFKDAMDEPTVSIPSTIDETRTINDSSDADLGSFFSRPVKVFEGVWSTGVEACDSFNPWKAYFENKRVSNRITNYNLMRCKLKVKFLINGNPFFFGRLMPIYKPLHNDDALSVNCTLNFEDNVSLSQFPRLFLDPATSSGGEMDLPFFWYKDYMSIPAGDWNDMGLILIRTLTNLKHVNGADPATDLVTITCYAWAEDVMLASPTHANALNITPQAGDEYEGVEGVISKPAAVVAKIAGKLTTVPGIGPFALATQLAASAIGDAASAFGYSRPVLAHPPAPYRPQPIGDLASTNTADNAKKLTVDAKQELSIDPRISGLGDTDEMEIKYIAKKESYWTNFDWVMNTPPETHLFNLRVDPCVWDIASIASDPTYFFPATAMASMPFKYWTGKMRYRFQVVASAMHRGRLAIVYDPVSTPVVREDNVNYIEIIDISQCREFTVEVSNNQPFTLLEHARPSSQDVSSLYDTDPLTFAAPYGNGTISVWVINELTTPTTDPTVNNDIKINVFLAAGDDFEVFVPDATEYSKFVVTPQSGTETTEIDSDSALPYKGVDATMGTDSKNQMCRNKVYSGEVITSFRQILKRYEFHNRRSVAQPGFNVVTFSQNSFPHFRGNVPGAVDIADGAPYNLCTTTLVNWVSLAYQGRRGGFRWKAIPNGLYGDISRVNNPMRITRDPGGLYGLNTITGPIYSTTSDAAYEGALEIDDSFNGTALTSWTVNPNEEFEIPYYSPYRFTGGKPTNFTTDTNQYEGFKITNVVTGGETLCQDALDLYCATAEDFTTYFFTGLPRMYRETRFPFPG